MKFISCLPMVEKQQIPVCVFGLTQKVLDLIYCVQRHFQQYFSYIMATSFSDGRNRSTRREPPAMGKPLVNFITCGSE
jgi:hypothetical protein